VSATCQLFCIPDSINPVAAWLACNTFQITFPVGVGLAPARLREHDLAYQIIGRVGASPTPTDEASMYCGLPGPLQVKRPLMAI